MITTVVSPPIVVVHIVGSLGWGGSEQQVCEIALGLNRQRFHTIVCCTGKIEGPRAKKLREHGVEVVLLPLRMRSILRDAKRLITFVRRVGADLVHAHTANNGLWGAIVSQYTRIPLIFSEYGFNSARAWNHRLLEVWRTRRASRVIVNSSALRQEILVRTRVNHDRVIVVPSGVQPQAFDPALDGQSVRVTLGIADNSVVIGTVGRLHPVKGHSYFLAAAQQVVAQCPEARFLIIGHGPDTIERRLRDQCHQLGLENYVKFIASAEEVVNFLAAMDVFVLASLSESLPISILEAMAMARPVVATRVGGVSEVVAPEDTGLLVPPKDTSALAEAIVRLCQHVNIRHQMGSAGRRRLETEFTANNMIKGVEAVYQEVLNT